MSLLRTRNNWGRWGADDQLGALNLITPEKRVAATRLVRDGVTISLSRPLPTVPGPANARPAQHYLTRGERGVGGYAGDFVGVEHHGLATTHIDALCHVWGDQGLWQGRLPEESFTHDRAIWGSIDTWRSGIIARGVLLDVPRYRGVEFVTPDGPVHDDELARIAVAQRVEIQPGDALVVYCGREASDRERPTWGSEYSPDGDPIRAGLHASCLEFLRDRDVAVLAWDMMDYEPLGLDIPWGVHSAIPAFGMAFVDNCDLEGLAAHCHSAKRYEFLFIVAPLQIEGGTGSPANPLAMF